MKIFMTKMVVKKMDLNMDKYVEFTKIKELVPGIETDKEKKSFSGLDHHKSELKNEELYFRVKQGVI